MTDAEKIDWLADCVGSLVAAKAEADRRELGFACSYASAVTDGILLAMALVGGDQRRVNLKLRAIDQNLANLGLESGLMMPPGRQP